MRLPGAAWLTVACCLLCATATARESVASLARKLESAEDFRVRTQAALALGASAKKAAVAPLCGGLDDKSDTVRAAAAAALGKLQRGGEDCLNKRLAKESKSNVKRMIKKALRLVREGANGPALSRHTKYYVAIGKVSTHAAGAKSKPGERVRQALGRGLATHRGYAIAPPGEPVALAKKRLRKHPQVIGFFFAPSIEVGYRGKNLRVRFVLNLSGYPDKSPMGFVERSAGYSGLDGKDAGREEQLIDKVVKSAVEELDKMAAQLD